MCRILKSQPRQLTSSHVSMMPQHVLIGSSQGAQTVLMVSSDAPQDLHGVWIGSSHKPKVPYGQVGGPLRTPGGTYLACVRIHYCLTCCGCRRRSPHAPYSTELCSQTLQTPRHKRVYGLVRIPCGKGEDHLHTGRGLDAAVAQICPIWVQGVCEHAVYV